MVQQGVFTAGRRRLRAMQNNAADLPVQAIVIPVKKDAAVGPGSARASHLALVPREQSGYIQIPISAQRAVAQCEGVTYDRALADI